VAAATDVSAVADGRVQRGARTRAAIVEALLTLLEAGHGQPTARAVAEAAGVSLRSVFQHFADMESLYASCVERQQQRLAALRGAVDPERPVRERVRAFVTRRSQLYERVAPVRRVARVLALNSPVLTAGLTAADADHHRAVVASFAPELAGRSRRERLAAVEVATCFDTWDHLRRRQRLSIAAAARVVEGLVRAALEGDGV
jgi:TetR/AcrR family transcriptional regulator of autoinduction and epiphytic fitness